MGIAGTHAAPRDRPVLRARRCRPCVAACTLIAAAGVAHRPPGLRHPRQELALPARGLRYDRAMSDDSHLGRYAEHARRLQTWIGAYGVGLASLLIYQYRTAVGEVRAEIKAALADDPAGVAASAGALDLAGMKDDLRQAFVLIAIAISLQVALLVLNKASQYAVAHTPSDDNARGVLHRVADRVSQAYWIDLMADLGSIGLLACATYAGLGALGLR